MNDAPDISVVMGVFNGARHLRETCESILGQERVSLEFIVINDGSTDSTAALLSEYAAKDYRVKVIHQDNQGLTKSLRRGCESACGTYIARQDVGDVSHRRRLSIQKAALDTCDELAFVSSWTAWFGPEWEFLYIFRGAGQATLPINILSETARHGVIDGPTCHPSVMFRRATYNKVGGYRAEFFFGQDWDLWYRLAEAGKFQIIGQPLYRARIMPSGISMSQKKRQEAIARLSLAAMQQRRLGLSETNVLERADTIRPSSSLRRPHTAKAEGLYFIGECLRRNGDPRSITYFKQSINAHPLFLKAWARIIQHKIETQVFRRDSDRPIYPDSFTEES